MTGTTNFFFNNIYDNQEQLLLEELIIEATEMYGLDVYYVPRKLNNYDPLYGADDQSSYDQAIPIAMYLEDYQGYGGDGDFMKKFGVEIRDQITFSVPMRSFSSEVATITTQIRPNEGDIIYFPLPKKCFQIKFVDKFQMFFQLGGLYTWKMTCELFEYSNELFDTGIPEIDALQTLFDTNSMDWGIMDEFGDYIMDECGNYLVLEASDLSIVAPGTDNEDITQFASEFVDFSTTDPFSEGF